MQAAAVLSPRSPRIIPFARMGDEALASRAAAGNNAAFAALYERYYEPLLGYCRSILLNAEDAHDATQSALENALRALPRREPGRALKPWLYRIAHNEAINIVRRRQPVASGVDTDDLLTVPGPEVDAEQRTRLAQLVDDLRMLPERQRGALVMRELSGLSYDEIGLALGVSNEAARRAVFDARTALHDAVDGRATECTSVRRCLSDGDRRHLRARGVRAHLRSCDDCATFERAMGMRQADLHMLGPWLAGGAGALGLLGYGTGTASAEHPRRVRRRRGGGAPPPAAAAWAGPACPSPSRASRSRPSWRRPAPPPSSCRRSRTTRRPHGRAPAPPAPRRPRSPPCTTRCASRRSPRPRPRAASAGRAPPTRPPTPASARATAARAANLAADRSRGAQVAPITPCPPPRHRPAARAHRARRHTRAGRRRQDARADRRRGPAARPRPDRRRLPRRADDRRARHAVGARRRQLAHPEHAGLDRPAARRHPCHRRPEAAVVSTTSQPPATSVTNVLAPVQSLLAGVDGILQNLFGRR